MSIRTEPFTADLLIQRREEACKKLADAIRALDDQHLLPTPGAPTLQLAELDALDNMLWNTLRLFQNHPFSTSKNLSYYYVIRGGELFVSRKEKSITKATVFIAFHKALELRGIVPGPKALGTFGASYLYPIFQQCGVIGWS